MLLVVACAQEVCDCGAGGNLFVRLADTVPGGSVEVCVDGSCGTAAIQDADGTADEAEVSFDALGGLEEKLMTDVEVLVTVFDQEDREVRSGAVRPVSAENCCGIYWTANL